MNENNRSDISEVRLRYLIVLAINSYEINQEKKEEILIKMIASLYKDDEK